ncbi:MAG: esterase-like activity of phytase family protein [Pseudomonadota bacterium]
MLWRLAVALVLPSQLALAEGGAVLSQVLQLPGGGNRAFNGISGIEVDAYGRWAIALNDKGWLFELQLTRDENDDLRAATAKRIEWPRPGGDSEGVAIAPDGTLYVSHEGPASLVKLMNYRFHCVASHEDFAMLGSNRSLEALAISPAGDAYVVPERPLAHASTLRVYRYRNGVWDVSRELPIDEAYYPVGADFGPDGLLYLLERAASPLGFRSRIRRFDPEVSDGPVMPVLETRLGLHDNLEGISVWKDGQGQTRITMVSDNNFLRIQHREIVEYVLND